MHGPELVVELRNHDAFRHIHLAEQRPDPGHRLPRIGQLPPHHHHQAEAEEQEEKRGNRVLDPDDLVVGGKNILLPEGQFVVTVIAVCMLSHKKSSLT